MWLTFQVPLPTLFGVPIPSTDWTTTDEAMKGRVLPPKAKDKGKEEKERPRWCERTPVKSDTGNLAGVYRTLCNYCHIPELFGHPSSEAKMMKELKDENASLNRENEQLKLRIEALTNSKRRTELVVGWSPTLST
eukprot:scaffold2518_cov272-Alexandrium_tamarense.AAC.21